MHQNQTDPEYPDKKGERLDGRDLIKEWVDKHPNSQYVWDKTSFDKIDAENVDHIIGIYLLNAFYFCDVLFSLLMHTIKCSRK